MKTFKTVFVLAVAALVAFVAAPSAHAGYWAATVLDPLPERIVAERTYTFGYWVMQHASHPYDGDYGKLGKTALKLVDESGKAYTFDGVSLGQTSHYAATVAVPHPGTWELYALQGIFEDYRIGTLSVPGGLSVRLLPPPVHSQDHEPDWGLIRPPELHNGVGEVSAHPAGSDREAREAGSAAARSQSPFPTNALWGLLALPVLAGALLVVRGRTTLGWVGRDRSP